MITKIVNCLHQFVLAIDLEYRYNFSDYTIVGKISDLKQAVDEYLNNPEACYKELFEPWCKVDVDEFVKLMDIILDKPDDWQDLSLKKYPSFVGVLNNLCSLYDEIVARLDLYKHKDNVLPQDITLPPELDNERARKYFARAIELGYMEQTATGYKWLFGDGKGQVRLGYFCFMIFEQPRPINQLEELFGVKKLSSSISNLSFIRNDVLKWKTQMDNEIFFD